MVNSPSAVGKERLDNEREDRYNEDLEVEREDWRFIKHLKVAEVGNSVVVRRMTHQRRVKRVENPYSTDLMREDGDESGGGGRSIQCGINLATTDLQAICNTIGLLGNDHSRCKPARRTCQRDCGLTGVASTVSLEIGRAHV